MDTSTAVLAPVDTLGRRIAPRHYRSDDEKLEIVAESRVAGTSVAEVARRHGVNANQVFAWRRQHQQGLLGEHRRRRVVKLLPVRVSEESPGRAESASRSQRAAPIAAEGRIEIILPDGVRIAISGAVPAERLQQVLSALRR
jgi:transposase